MPLPWLAVPRLHLERARDHEGGSEIAWCTDYWWEECLVRGWWWWRELKEVNKPPCSPKFTKPAPKIASFLHFLAYKSPKTPFFNQKHLIKYTPKTFF
jgi:hypothetical protein